MAFRLALIPGCPSRLHVQLILHGKSGGIYEPLEAARSDNFLSRECSEDARDDLVRGIFVVLLELVIFRNLFSAREMIRRGSKVKD